MHEQWLLHCTSQWGQKTLLSEHMYYVSIPFKRTEQVEQWICIKFCIKLEHSSMETIQMIEKAEAVGNWWLAASYRQHTWSHITSHAEVSGKTSNLPSDSGPLQPRCDSLRLLAYPKAKITFEREEISDHQWGSRKHDGAADGNWDNCMRSQSACFEGDRGIIVLPTVFLVSCIFIKKCP